MAANAGCECGGAAQDVGDLKVWATLVSLDESSWVGIVGGHRGWWASWATFGLEWGVGGELIASASKIECISGISGISGIVRIRGISGISGISDVLAAKRLTNSASQAKWIGNRRTIEYFPNITY